MKRYALLVATLLACGGGDDDGAVTIIDGPTPTDAPTDAPRPIDAPGVDDPDPCTDLLNTGTLVFEQFVAEFIPAAAGGDIAPGTYHLTRQTFYTGIGGATGPSGSVGQSTLRVGTDGSMEANIVADDFFNQWIGLISTEGTFLTTEFLCPPMDTEINPYTAAGGDLKIYFPNSGLGRELVFTRQP